MDQRERVRHNIDLDRQPGHELAVRLHRIAGRPLDAQRRLARQDAVVPAVRQRAALQRQGIAQGGPRTGALEQTDVQARRAQPRLRRADKRPA